MAGTFTFIRYYDNDILINRRHKNIQNAQNAQKLLESKWNAICSEFEWKEKLEILKLKCAKYNVDYVYKKCNESWIIVLKKISETKTNEDRKDVKDISRAKFRANQLKVEEIINIIDPSKTKQTITNKYGNVSTTYKVGETVFSDSYDYNIERVCSNGIHYFRTIEPAYFYEGPPENYTGYVITFHDNGEKRCEGSIIYGKKYGRWNYWWYDGSMNCSGNYFKGALNGKWEYYDFCGNKSIILYAHGREISRSKL